MIRVENLGFSYPPGISALRAVYLDIYPGENLAIIGPNGSGKTTLARCLNGLNLPQEGRVEVDGFSTSDPKSLFEVRRRVGMVFQNPDDQLVSTTVETEIAFGLENLAVPPAEMRARVEEMLQTFHLEAYRRHPPHRLSGGEKQRVAIAAAVALRPQYLVLDEPTALLDPQSRREVSELLCSLRDRLGIATIHITQFPEEAAHADRVIVMHQGSIFRDTSPADLFADPESLWRLGLGVPFPCALLARLRDRGYSLKGIPPVPRDLDSLAEAIAASGDLPPIPPWTPPPSPPTRPGKLVAEGLSYIYDQHLPTEHPALVDVDANIPDNQIVALIGPSGSGKTTLAQHFNALLKPHRGRVLLDGLDIWTQPLPRIRQRVGLVFQFPELQLFEESVELDVAFGPRNLGYPPERIELLVSQALEMVGLPRRDFGRRSPLSLSGGERRRAALAGILAMDPEVLVLDEPTVGLDPGSARAMSEVFRQLQHQGKTLVLITHDMDLVAALATQVVVLDKGRVQLQGFTRQVLADPRFAQLRGLELPAAIRLAQALAARGIAVPPGLLTLDELVDILLAKSLPTSASTPPWSHPCRPLREISSSAEGA